MKEEEEKHLFQDIKLKGFENTKIISFQQKKCVALS